VDVAAAKLRPRLEGSATTPAAPGSSARGGELAGLDERKWMAREHSAPTYILIYNGKVAMISLSATGEPVGVVIEDEALYTTQAMIFNKLWETL